MKHNERLQAVRILTRLLQDRTPLSHLLQAETHSPLTKEICFGVCRHYFFLESLAKRLLKKKPKEIEIWISLLIGLYQLRFLRIPDYAVVKETVALMDQIKKPWAKGLINAVLRTYCREQDSSLQVLEPHTLNHPDWFIQAMQKAWPDDWQNILQANDVHPPMSLRVNGLRTTVPEYLARLQSTGMIAKQHPYAPFAIELQQPCDVFELPGFKEGDISVQDVAAQLAIPLLSLKPGLRVLDACSAPGGKTCHILETEPELSACIAMDIDNTRLFRVKENLARLHLHASLLAADALHTEKWWDGEPFDRILLDAPCSATGVIRRHPDIKILRTENDISTAVNLQQRLLHALWPLLAPGGLLIYATCSVMPQENEQQIAEFVSKQKDSHFVLEKKSWGHFTGHGWQLFPGENNMDGFFYSVLSKLS